ncbi:hypothetical protein [Neobacillus soli]|uniref:hypothetical protein n=1 Tax=Neobacillus soli TaxID=220688 RepID=UPI000825FF02|nr:hypothetical protein [Neobacillus soli]
MTKGLLEPLFGKEPVKGYPIGAIGARLGEKVGQGVSNQPYWNKFRRKSRSKGFQSALLEQVKAKKSVKRSPIGAIGTC